MSALHRDARGGIVRTARTPFGPGDDDSPRVRGPGRWLRSSRAEKTPLDHFLTCVAGRILYHLVTYLLGIIMISDTLSSTLGAIADPTRRAILMRLSDGEATVSELAEPFDITMPAVSKHLKVLERAGLIERGRDAQRRPCRLRPEPLREVSNWLDRYRAPCGARPDHLDECLCEQPRGARRDG